ncbi:MAG: FAD-dependent oxidoreductase, partial [Pseudomonadota bacterium]
MHRIIVIGRGLIGSAAARHLAESTDGIACVGPDEPVDRATHTGVFASHYDEGRMTRIVDPSPEWSITAKRSIARYRDIESRSGIGFFTPAGYLGLGSPGNDYNQRSADTGEACGAVTERLTAPEIRARFPFLSIPDDTDGLVETETAGHISPRSMVKAQTHLAEAAGCTMHRHYATAVRPVTDGVEVEASDGTVLTGRKVVIAAGAFTPLCGITPVDLGLVVFGRTTVLARIDDAAAEELAGMPTMIHCVSGAYILPPIRYPDGHSYLKIGIGTAEDERFETLSGLQAWFKSDGSEDNREEFTGFLQDLFPVLQR